MGVGPDGVDVAGRPGRIGQVLLTDQHERTVGHPPGRDVGLGRGHLLERAADVHRPGAAAVLVAPRHPALDGQIDLVRRRARAGTDGRRGRPGREPVPGDLSTPRGDTSSSTTSAGATSANDGTRRPSRSAAEARSSAASASVIALDPPRATGHPYRWADSPAPARPTRWWDWSAGGRHAPPYRRTARASLRCRQRRTIQTPAPVHGRRSRRAAAGVAARAPPAGGCRRRGRRSVRPDGAKSRRHAAPRARGRSPCRRSTAAGRRPCRRRAGARGRSPASTTRARAGPVEGLQVGRSDP